MAGLNPENYLYLLWCLILTYHTCKLKLGPHETSLCFDEQKPGVIVETRLIGY